MEPYTKGSVGRRSIGTKWTETTRARNYRETYEKMSVNEQELTMTQSRQRSYANVRCSIGTKWTETTRARNYRETYKKMSVNEQELTMTQSRQRSYANVR
jgi:Fe-S cluster biosynthesis and repair protein YggX